MYRLYWGVNKCTPRKGIILFLMYISSSSSCTYMSVSIHSIFSTPGPYSFDASISHVECWQHTHTRTGGFKAIRQDCNWWWDPPISILHSGAVIPTKVFLFFSTSLVKIWRDRARSPRYLFSQLGECITFNASSIQLNMPFKNIKVSTKRVAVPLLRKISPP